MKITKNMLKKLILVFIVLCISTMIPYNVIALAKAEGSFDSQTETGNSYTNLNFMDDSVIVVLDPNINQIKELCENEFFDIIEIESIIDLTKQEGETLVQKPDFKPILKICLKEKSQANVLIAVDKLRKVTGVISAEPNYYYALEDIPSDPYYASGKLWGLSNSDGIKAPLAWNIIKGSNSVRVGVIDTGIAKHEDLDANLCVGVDTFNNNLITTDDTHSHGTHVAGTIGAVGNNSIGIVGVNWNVDLVPLQAANKNNLFSVADVVEAISWAEAKWGTSEQIDIINYSVGGLGETTAIRNAVSNFHGLFIWAAGNETCDIDTRVSVNGSFDLDNIISVGAIDAINYRCDFSNYSTNNTNVNIYAPGSYILSTAPEYMCAEICHKAGTLTETEQLYKNGHYSDGYHYKSGTSMAAPHVAGVAALMLSVNPDLSGAELKSAILNNSDTIKISIPSSSGDTTPQYVRKLNAYKAVSSVAFKTNEEGDSVTGLNFVPSTDLTIPESINNKIIAKIGDNAFANQTRITKIILPDTVESIGENAFSGCINLNSISSLNSITTIGRTAFQNCTSLQSIYIPSNTTYIGAAAFAGCSNLNITVSAANPDYTAQDNILYSKYKTGIISAGNVAPTVHIPDTVTWISPSAFEGNSKLKELHIKSTPEIEQYAFANCENLEAVYFYSYTLPKTASGAFVGDNFMLYVPHSSQGEYYTKFVGVINGIASIPIKVTFVSGENVVYTLDTYYGAIVKKDIYAPYKEGYDFSGWYDNADYAGMVYENGGLWDSLNDITLYAKLTPQQFYIKFAGYGSENLVDKLVTYDSIVGELPNLERTGYTFDGWRDEYGNKYEETTVWKSLYDKILTSQWKVNEYTITFDVNGGEEYIPPQSAAYGTIIGSFPVAKRKGHTFKGWNTLADGSGETIEAMYTLYGDITLYAQYTPNVYKVMFDNQGGEGDADGVDVVYGEPMPTEGVTAPTKEGYTFIGYYAIVKEEKIYYYDSNMQSILNWDREGNWKLHADWKPNTYNVTLIYQDNEETRQLITVTYGEAIQLDKKLERDGYTFDGLNEKSDGTGVWYYKKEGDIERVNVWNKAKDGEIYVCWTPNIYTVTLDKQGGSGGTDSVVATYSMSMPSAIAPTRTGYIFQGYYCKDDNGEYVKYYDSNMKSAQNWDQPSNSTLYALWEGIKCVITFDKQGGEGGSNSVTATYGSPMPDIIAPTKTGYMFKGYYTQKNGNGRQYYMGVKFDDTAVIIWDRLDTDITLYAYWEINVYTITVDWGYNNRTQSLKVAYDSKVTAEGNWFQENRVGYIFKGIFSEKEGKGIQYFRAEVQLGTTQAYDMYRLVPFYYTLKENEPDPTKWTQPTDGIIYAYWELIEIEYKYEIVISNANEASRYNTIKLVHGEDKNIEAEALKGYIFEKMYIAGEYYTETPYLYKNIQLLYNIGYKERRADSSYSGQEYYVVCQNYTASQAAKSGFFMVYKKDNCVAEGSLITLADGSQKAVEELTGNEKLLVWNLYTGNFDVAPILFIDKEAADWYEIINLKFSDGTHVKVISEHAFWDFNLNQYVFLRSDADKYIGHWFNKQIQDSSGNLAWTKVQLIDVTLTEEYTTAYSPVTYGHLCLYVNGMLSMPGATSGLVNIFEVDGESMQINAEKFEADIATYGLYTYEEFAELFPIPEEIFNAVCGQYLKVSLGKGLITHEELLSMIERYSVFFE